MRISSGAFGGGGKIKDHRQRNTPIKSGASVTERQSALPPRTATPLSRWSLPFSVAAPLKTNIGNNEGQRRPIDKVGLLLDLAEHKVSFAGYVAHTEDVDGANIFFGSAEDHARGDINRVTGLMSATTVSGNVDTSYELFCKPVTHSKSQKTK